MEKIIISKELAYDVKYWKSSIGLGIKNLIKSHKNELASFMYDYNFDTLYQVAGYLLGGQDKVYEVKKEPYLVIWSTESKDFYTLPYNYPLEEAVEIVVNTYDILEDAEETAE